MQARPMREAASGGSHRDKPGKTSIDPCSIRQNSFTVEIEGRGEREPVAPNENVERRDNPAGRQQNRRVEIDACLAARRARFAVFL